MNSCIERDIFVLRDVASVAQPIEYVQGTNAVPILLHIRDYVILENSTARVYVEWPSTKGEYDTAIIEGNSIRISVKDTMFSEVGKCSLQIVIVNGEDTLVTFAYPVVVKKNQVPGITSQSKNKSDFLDEYMQNLDERMVQTNEVLQTALEKAEEVENNTQTVIEKANDTSEKAIKAQSYAVGGTGTRENEEVDNSKYYAEQSKKSAEKAEGIVTGLDGIFFPCGSKSFEELSSVEPQPGYTYNITNDFVTDDTFDCGAGIKFPAGTDVYYTIDGKWSCFAGPYVFSVNGKKGAVELNASDVGAVAIGGDVAENTVTYTEDTALEELTPGEKLSAAFGKIKLAVKNVISIAKLLGNTDISKIGNGTVTGVLSDLNTNLSSHTSNKSNPHGVTKAQLGLGNVDNTKDSAKSVNKANCLVTQTTTESGLDTITDNGIYFISSNPGLVLHLQYDSGFAWQIWFNFGTTIYARTKTSGKWSDWRTLHQ